MRKIVLFIAALLFMAVPVMAVSNVTISCVPDGNKVTVSYASNLNLIRAFGLDITVVGANITKVVPVDANYRIFPGQITIAADGNVTDYGTCYDPCDLGDANVTIEMGSLYTTDSNYSGDPNAGYLMRPGLGPNTLLKFYVSGNCTYAVTENAARGGVVMEDPDENAVVTLCSGSVVVGCTVPNVVHMTEAAAITAITTAGFPAPTVVYVNGGAEPIGQVASQSPVYTGSPIDCGTIITINVSAECMKATHPDYANWVHWNKPNCWCYSRQCRGDADGLKQGAFWVSSNDITIYRGAVNKLEAQIPAGGICADFDRQKQGAFWVSGNDIVIYRLYVNKLEASVPVCDATHINFWCTPAGCP
jgi:hypothetical protein